MFYRIKQVYNAVFAKVEQNEYLWLGTVLNSKELALFHRQSLTEQRHAFDVAYDIQYNNQLLKKIYGEKNYEDILKASLLHDCGKSLIKLRLWQRIFIVILGYLPNEWKNKASKQRNIFGKTLMIYQLHPSWGKCLAKNAGTNEHVQCLILNHHTPVNPLDMTLYNADNRH